MQDLIIHSHPSVKAPVMVLGLTGWMDGGHVSTGTVAYLGDKLGASPFAEIRPHDFYILNFPISTIPLSVHAADGKAILTSVSPMEVAAVFRPHTKIENGIIEELIYPKNEFSCSETANLILFSGEEPHIRWGTYCDCMFSLAEGLGVKEIYFIGSVAAPLPHTREPRMRASVAREDLKARLAGMGVGYSQYEGPASIITALSYHSVERGIEVRSLVVEVPHYPFIEMPAYPRSILKTTSALNTLLNLGIDLTDLRDSSALAEEKLNAVMEDNEDFQALVSRLEEAYDQEESSEDDELLKRLMEGIDLEGDENLN